MRRSGARLIAAALLAGCGDGTGPRRIEPPPFLFVAGEGNAAELVKWENGTATPLTENGLSDTDPHVAANRDVFVSNRDAGAEVYFATLDLAEPSCSRGVCVAVVRSTAEPTIALATRPGTNPIVDGFVRQFHPAATPYLFASSRGRATTSTARS